MPHANIVIIRDGDAVPWPEVDREQLIHHTDSIYFAVVDGGMSSGKPSIGIRVDLADGRTVVAETSLDIIVGLLAACRGAFPDAFADGPFAP